MLRARIIVSVILLSAIGGLLWMDHALETDVGFTLIMLCAVVSAVDEFYGLGYVDELAYAVDCVLNDVEPKYGVSGRAGLACVQIVKAMYESSETGKAVRGEWG